MIIIRLTEEHINSVIDLFKVNKHMGVDFKTNYFTESADEFQELSYNIFCDTYLSNLNNFKAFGSMEDGKITSIIAFYESEENPEWYWTQIRSKNASAIPFVLDKVVEYNEGNGRLKFYSLFNSKYAKTYRRLAFSKTMRERYGFFDEFLVPAKHKCFYQTPWQVLYNRTLVPTETLVRCTFLKQEYRHELPNLGGL